MFFCLEGCDAVGKQTQSKRLVEKFDSIGRVAVVMSFPRYDTPVGKAIRRHLMNEVMLTVFENRDGLHMPRQAPAPEDPLVFQCMQLADKMDAAVDVEAHIYAGRTVICDRWTPSAICFGEADGLDAHWLQRVQEVLPQTALNVFIDVPEDEALRRRPEMRDRYEKDREKQKAIRQNYKTLWEVGAEEDAAAWVVVDGVGTVDEVTERIWKHVLAALDVTA
jgi:dTMP kinase